MPTGTYMPGQIVKKLRKGWTRDFESIGYPSNEMVYLQCWRCVW